MEYKEIEAKVKGVDLPATAVNENGDNVIIDYVDGCYKVATLQKNGWCKTNIFHPDGTIEELYER